MGEGPKIPDVFNSKTDKILLELPGYKFSHSPSTENDAKQSFLGREKLISRLEHLIISSSSNTGVYLVTGNRGVGKSSLVEKVIAETSLPKSVRRDTKKMNKYENDNFESNDKRKRNRIYLKINFGHDVLNERDILRLITLTLTTKYDEFCHSLIPVFWGIRRILLLLIVLFVCCFFIVSFVSHLFDDNIYKNDLHSQIEQMISKCFSENKKENEKIRDINQIDNVVSEVFCYVRSTHGYFEKKCQFYPSIIYSLVLTILIFYLLDKLLLRGWGGSNPTRVQNFIFYLLDKLSLRSKLSPRHHSIKKRLKRLNETIAYSIEREVGVGGGIVSNFMGAKKRTSRLIANAREIEKELQDILDEIKEIPDECTCPEFVIVFDELDKVSPELLNKNEATEDGKIKETMFATNTSRERQAVILKLLSNMKYFLSTAQAKFIFIAGREMYDMYLADIADRNNYFGSIFNDVILVPSFLTDTDKRYNGDATDEWVKNSERFNITALTEVFVCHHLIPKNYTPEDDTTKDNQTKELNLKVYKEYLEKEIFNLSNIDPRENKRRIQKVIAILQQFIIYLSHTSKGAPKKMMQIFESFIVSSKLRHSDDGILVVKRCSAFVIDEKRHNKSSFFLSFDYYNQFAFGITSYLVSPIIYRLADANIQHHSDKLLVSTLNLLDYMLKFHSQNFSLRQLDISPEVIETNHSPELKAIINDVVTLYSQTHFTKPIISLFDYKFDSLLSHEISFISKMDERFSAQFSFSLDESLALKQYFRGLLKEKQLEYEKSKKYGKTSVGSISSIQIILGDLHFLDDELEVAALYYKDGMHFFDKKRDDKNSKNLDFIYRLIRNQLKMAHLYEKRKQPEFAYSEYGEIVQYLTEVYCKGKLINIPFEKLQLFYLPLLARLQILEKCSSEGILEHDIEMMEKDFNFLFCIIKKNDMKILTADFYSKVGDILYYKNKIFSENHLDINFPEYIEMPHYACYYYKKALIELILEKGGDREKDFCNKTVMRILKEKAKFIYEKTNIEYCNVIARVLSNLGDVYFSAREEMCINCPDCEFRCKLLCVKTGKNGSGSFWRNWHMLFTDHEFELDNFLKNISIDTLNNIELALFLYSLSIKFYKKACMYRQSALQITKILSCFKSCLKNEEYGRMLQNEIMRFCNDINGNPDQNNIQYIANRAIEFLYMANDALDMFEILKRKKDLDDEAYLQYIQVDSEIIKIILLQKEVELSISKSKNNGYVDTDTLNELYDDYIISPYCINYSVVARVHQLNLKAKLNWETYKIIKDNLGLKTTSSYDTFFAKLNNNGNKLEKGKICKIFSDEKLKQIPRGYNFFALLEFLVADSIFCYTKILRLIKTSDDSYIFNHRFFAGIYEKLAIWTEIYNVFKHISEDEFLIYKFVENVEQSENEATIKYLKENRIETYLEILVGKDFKEQLSTRYYRQKAFLHYHKSIETHTGGRAYFNLLEQMYFIKGDYDDITSHFNVAMERFVINKTGRYKKELEMLKTDNEKSSLYKADNYFDRGKRP